jgi:hypothetical protein
MVFNCQCCNKLYEVDYGIFMNSVCPHCMWEQDDTELDEYSDPNGCSLIEYRGQHGIDV